VNVRGIAFAVLNLGIQLLHQQMLYYCAWEAIELRFGSSNWLGCCLSPTPFAAGRVGSASTIPTLFPTPTPLVGTPHTPTPVITPVPGPREGLGDREGEALASLADVEGMFLFEEYCCCEGRGWVIIEVEDVAVRLGVPDSWNPECG